MPQPSGNPVPPSGPPHEGQPPHEGPGRTPVSTPVLPHPVSAGHPSKPVLSNVKVNRSKLSTIRSYQAHVQREWACERKGSLHAVG